MSTGPVAKWIRHLTSNQGIPGSSPGRVVSCCFKSVKKIIIGKANKDIERNNLNWPCGPMDKASDYESGDSRFESWQGRFWLL